MASTLAFVIASSMVSPSQNDIAKACAVVDSGGVVMVQEQEETKEVSSVKSSHQGPGQDIFFFLKQDQATCQQ